MANHQSSLHKDRPVTSGDKEAAKIARQLHEIVQKVSISAVDAGAQNHVHCMIILAQAANGLLHLLARAAMRDEDKDVPIHSTATLFAALLAYQTAPCEHTVGNVHAEFSPLIVFDALKDMEKLTGQRPDDLLVDGLCRVARECAADPAMVNAIQQGRAEVERAGSPLN